MPYYEVVDKDRKRKLAMLTNSDFPCTVALTLCYNCESCNLRFKCFSSKNEDVIDITENELKEYIRRGKWKKIKTDLEEN
jgi:hypothetical protein